MVIEASAQLDWLARAPALAPLADGEIRSRLAPSLLDAIGGPPGFNAALAGLGQITVCSILASRPDHAQAVVRCGGMDFLLRAHVDGAGLITDFAFTPDEAPPGSWAAIDARLAGLGARVSFAAAEIGPDGQCNIVHGLDADTQRPIGSAFKLYVLGALGQAVTSRSAAWDERLAIRDDWKSLPTGTLQNEPAGTTLTLADYADLMISISDNTATDHLIHRLGRDALQRQLTLFGHQHPEANTPPLTTKAFFHLRLDPVAAQRYLALPSHERAAAQQELDRLPLPHQAWDQPRNIDEIEWFASPTDICHAYAGLVRLAQPEIAHALTLNDDKLNLNESRFPTVWSKPGSEPGVMTLNYLAHTTTGRAVATTLMVSDPTTALDDAATMTNAQAVIRAAFHLLATPE
jgi:hypothetical protein